MVRSFAIVVLAMASGNGCERGCLSRWIAEQGSAPAPAPSKGAGGFDLAGTDCSDGLLRCNAGNVEASRMAHLSSACAKGPTPEKTGTECACPWDLVLRCPSGCVDEDMEVAGSIDAGARQLCRPMQPVARPVLRADDAGVDVCSDEGIACREATIHVCSAAGAPSRPIARCIFGCAVDITVESPGDGRPMDPAGVSAILCRRSDAERP